METPARACVPAFRAPQPAEVEPETPLRLLIVLSETFHSDGGIQMYNRAVCRAASDFVLERGGSVEVLCQNDATSELDNRYLPAQAGTFRGFEGSRARLALAALRAAAHRPDRIFLGHAQYLPLAPIMRCLSPGHLGCFLHGTDAWAKWGILQHLGARSCTEFFSVSRYTRDQVQAVNRTGRTPIFLFPDTLDPFWRPPPPTAAHKSSANLLTVARLSALERYKGVDTVLEALPRIRGQFPNVVYRVVGDGTDRPRLEALSQHLGVTDCVRFLGRVGEERLHREYAASDLYVMPSPSEGFGIVFIEAASHRKPSVGARGGGTPEVIRDGVTGALVPPRDPAALATTILELLKSPERLRSLGDAAFDDLEARFSFTGFRRRFAELLDSPPRLAPPDP
jgi:phosphatidylinositol alpha-1,6-mannosyltransferase